MGMNLVFLKLGVSMIRGVVARFPLVALFACIWTGFVIYAIDGVTPSWLERLIIVFGVSFFVGLAGYIFAERFRRDKAAVSALLVIFAEAYFWYLPDGFGAMRGIDVAQIVLLLVVSIIAVFSAPYFISRQVNGFWQYNRQLLKRLFFTVFSSGTLFAGIAISLASLQFLFEWQIEPEWYFRICILIVGFVSTTVFLAGIPKNFDHLEVMGEYPFVLEVFSRYVLVPLLVLYASILYVYGGKIFLMSEWPKGGVAFFVFWYALIGVATCFLLFPRRDLSLWIRPMVKAFFITLIPLAVLLWGAILIRVSEYGLTPNRGGMMLFGLWMVCVSIFGLTKKRDDVRYLFFAAAISILIFSFGPLSVFSVARSSQSQRLEKLLSEHSLLVKGAVNQEGRMSMSEQEKEDIRSIVRYLWEVRGLDEMGARIGLHAENVTPEDMLMWLGIEYGTVQDEQLVTNESHDYWFSSYRQSAIDINGYAWLHQFSCTPGCIIDGKSEDVSFVDGVLRLKDRKTGVIVAEFDLIEQAQWLSERYIASQQASGEMAMNQSVPLQHMWRVVPEDMMLEKNQGKLKIKIFLDELHFRRTNGMDSIVGVEGMLLITRP